MAGRAFFSPLCPELYPNLFDSTARGLDETNYSLEAAPNGSATFTGPPKAPAKSSLMKEVELPIASKEVAVRRRPGDLKLGQELIALRDEKGYGSMNLHPRHYSKHPDTEPVACLTWHSHGWHAGAEVLGGLFPDFELLQTSWKSRQPSSPVMVAATWNSDATKKTYRDLSREIAGETGGTIPWESLANVATQRDAYEKEMRRGGERLSKLASIIRSILAVWYAEAVAVAENEEAAKRTARSIWQAVTGGRWGADFSASALRRKLEHKRLPTWLALCQAEGLALWIGRMHGAIEDLIPTYNRWWAFELLLDRALAHEPVMSIEEVEILRQKEKEDHSASATGRHSQKRNDTWARRTRNLARQLLARDPDTSELFLHPHWKGKTPKDLFAVLANKKGEEHLKADNPSDSIRNWFKDNLSDEEYPQGRGNIEGWVPLAREWAANIPPHLFKEVKRR